MKPKIALRLPRKKLEMFCRRYPVMRLAVFGSVVRGEASPDSDIDILVTFKPGAHVGFLLMGEMRRELSGIFKRPVDLVPEDGLKPVIREAVLSEALEIYAA